ncbi:hypothetical protein [Streptomyces sp. NPDC055912]|uniref:hypothetical protein n=1 Tax=Streptomyces sp. NPDC055912 TaxID=3345660 RepID=UPI0035D64D10
MPLNTAEAAAPVSQFRTAIPRGQKAAAAAAGTLEGAPARCPRCYAPDLRLCPGASQCGKCRFVLGDWRSLAYVDGYTFTHRNGLLSYVRRSPRDMAVSLMAAPLHAVRKGAAAAEGWTADESDGGPVLGFTYATGAATAKLTYSTDGTRYLLTVTTDAGAELFRKAYKGHATALRNGRKHADATAGRLAVA